MGVTQGSTPVVKCGAEADVISSVYVPNGIVDVAYLLWVSKTAIAGDDLLVSDGDGNEIWPDIADGANYTKLFVLKHPVKDLTVTVMDSGALYVIKAPQVGWNG